MYPKWFRFHSRAEEKKRNGGGRPSNRIHKKVWIRPTMATSSLTQQPEMMEVNGDERKEQRNQRRRERNKNIPCSFFHSKKGCRRGDQCTFLHDENIADHSMEAGNGQDGNKDLNDRNSSNITGCDKMDVDMDELTDQVEKSVQISIPKNISFGRRRK